MCATSCPLPCSGSKLKNTRRFSSTWLYKQSVEGKRAHCRLVKPCPSSTSSGGPPASGIRNMRTDLRLIEAWPYCRYTICFPVRSQPWQHRLLCCRRPATPAWFGPAIAGKCGRLRRGPSRTAPACCRASRPTADPAFHPESSAAVLQPGSVAFDSGDVNIRLPALFHIGQPLSIDRAAEVLDSRLDLKSAAWLRPPGFPVRGSIFTDQTLESFWLGGSFVQHIHQAISVHASAGPSRA